MFFFTMIILSTVTILSSSSWFSIWLALEINLISFISYCTSWKNPKSIEAVIIYFITQSIASILLLFSIISYMIDSYLNMFFEKINTPLFLFSLFMKIGAAPVHFWIPMVMEGFNWNKNYLLMTWQKLGPLLVIFYNFNYYFTMLFLIMSAIIGALGGLNQSSIKKMMSYSSINQVGWLLACLSLSKQMWAIYYLFYFFTTFSLTLIFNIFNLKMLNQLFNFKMLDKFLMLFIFFNIFSMGGLPPFLGFYPKMLLISMVNNELLMLLLILSTLITLYFYLRLMYNVMLMNSLKVNLILQLHKINIKLLMFTSLITNSFLLLFLFV